MTKKKSAAETEIDRIKEDLMATLGLKDGKGSRAINAALMDAYKQGCREADAAQRNKAKRERLSKLINATRVVALDRRLAAIHEAGHVVIANSFGVQCQAWIMPEFDAEDLLEDQNLLYQKTWTCVARFGRYGSFETLTAQKRRMIAVAGAIAEGRWAEGHRTRADATRDWFNPAVMSESDWRLANCPLGKPSKALFAAINKVGRLLRPDGALWPELITTARDLMVQSRQHVSSYDLPVLAGIKVVRTAHYLP